MSNSIKTLILSLSIVALFLSCKTQKATVKKVEEKQKNSFASFNNTKWILQNNNQDVLVGNVPVTIEIDQTNQSISGFLGCNNMFSSYTSSEPNKIKLAQGTAITQKFCLDVEDNLQLPNLLEQANRYQIKNNILTFYKDNLALLSFRADK